MYDVIGLLAIILQLNINRKMIDLTPDIFTAGVSSVGGSFIPSLELGQKTLIENIGMGETICAFFKIQKIM